MRKSITRRTGVWAILAAVVWLAGCAGGGAPPAATSFLEHPERLKADQKAEGIWWWEAPGVDWGRYDKLKIDPVAVRVDTAGAEREVTKAEVVELAVKLRRAVLAQLGRTIPVVDRPGPGVLRVRAALTNVKPVSPAMNVVTTAILMWPLDAGDATIEVRFSDGGDGRLLGEVLALQQGSTMEVHKVWTRWGQVESAFDRWGIMLREGLAETRGGRQPAR